jgi:SOS response regulatory protein OraA/RecX
MSKNLPALSNEKPPEKLYTLKLQEEIEDKFIEILYKYDTEYTPVQAAIEAGYSKTYAENIKYTKLKNPKFIAKLKDRYNGYSSFMLPDIFKSEASSVKLSNRMVQEITEQLNETEDLEERVKLTDKALNILGKASHTRKELKQTAGVLASDASPMPQIVNIEKIQALINNNHVTKRAKSVSDNQAESDEG